MRRSDKEITDRKIIEEILETSDICRLGMVDGKEAYIVPVNYAYENGIIYIHSASQGRKMNLLQQNGNVTFEIEYASEILRDKVPCKWTTKYRSVMGRGRITIQRDQASKKKGLDLIMKKYGANMPLRYNKRDLDAMVLLRLKIESVSGKQAGDW